jgi:uncharacterized protein YecE (DUF72 family)
MLDLFDSAFDRNALGQAIAKLAQTNVFVGTSSWKYEGWIGQLYDRTRYETRGKFSSTSFNQECLAEYAQFFRTVCVDAGYYRFPDAQYLERLCGNVPPDFQFTFKVTDEITLRRFPDLPRFEGRRGRSNPHFLSAELFREEFLGPLSSWRGRVGVLIFEFAAFRPYDFRGSDDFTEQLAGFLDQLPPGWNYAVEIRNPEFLTEDYLSVLDAYQVAHVINQWTRMPDVDEQLARTGIFPGNFIPARFLLAKGRTYEEAVAKFSPYREIREVNQAVRKALRQLIWDIPVREGKPVFCYVNNRLEGNALNTIWAVVHGD